MISGRIRTITGLILSSRSSGSLVANMKKEEIVIGSNIGVAESTGTTCKRVFSSTKKLIIPERNRLMEEIIEASECLKN
jgi:hypothetical protein